VLQSKLGRCWKAVAELIQYHLLIAAKGQSPEKLETDPLFDEYLCRNQNQGGVGKPLPI
jgi:hypothetical protein